MLTCSARMGVGAPPCENALKAITTFRLDWRLMILVVPPVIFSYKQLYKHRGLGQKTMPLGT